MTGSPENEIDLVRLAIYIGWGLSVAIVFIHASYNDQSTFTWALIALVLPGLGFIAYFLFYYLHGINKTVRRAHIRAERRWEFQLTDKGRKKDPNIADEEDDNTKGPHPGHREEIIEESPLSRDVEQVPYPGHMKEVVEESPLSRDIPEPEKPEPKGPTHPGHSKSVIDESPPSRDIEE